ncbi:hypothetical protein MTO96_024281 [Rhipicephalus appendiculatus]
MNRLNTTNLLELITPEVEFQTQSPFLLYKSGCGIYCIWFYDTSECERVGTLCQSLARESKMSSKSKNRQRCASESKGPVQHEESRGLFYWPKAAPKWDSGPRKPNLRLVGDAEQRATGGCQQRPPRQCVVPSEPAQAPSTPLSVESLFAAVGQKKPMVNEAEDAKDALLRALLSNPDNRVEHVERIQRKEADANGDLLCEQPRLRAASCQANITAWEMSDDLRHKLNLCCSSSSSAENSVLPPVVTPAMLEMGIGNTERRPSPTTATFGDPLSGREPCKAPPASDLPLLTPMAFTKPVGQPAAMPSLSFGTASFATPNMFMNGDVVAKNQESVSALTKDQLRDALVHMLQTDDGFLVKLHEAYVGSLKSRFNLDTRTGNGSSMGTLL